MNLKYKTIGEREKSSAKELPIEHIPYVVCTHEIPVFFFPCFVKNWYPWQFLTNSEPSLYFFYFPLSFLTS